MEIKTVARQATLAIRTTVPMEKLSEAMGESYGAIAAYMGRKGIPFAGSPYALYRNMDMSALDVEIGFPVSAPAEGEENIIAAEIPGGTVATHLYTGPYTGIGTAYEALKAYVDEKGRTSGDWCYEFYLNSPEDTEPEELQTQICFPLTD